MDLVLYLILGVWVVLQGSKILLIIRNFNIGRRIEWGAMAGYIEKAMRAGRNHFRVVFKADGHRVYFVKRIPSSGSATFVLHVRSRCKKDFNDARRHFIRTGIPYEERAHCVEYPHKCLEVDIGKNDEFGSKLCEELMHAVYRIPGDAALRVGFFGPITVREGAIEGWDPAEFGSPRFRQPLLGLEERERIRYWGIVRLFVLAAVCIIVAVRSDDQNLQQAMIGGVVLCGVLALARIRRS